MTGYFSPAGAGVSELLEKRSRFIGRVVPVSDENEAKEEIARIKAKYHDARHNCWCYIIRDGGIERYSDGGEPQGTAGLPMLEAFRRGGVQNVCCVVTRYFGGILLGPGGLMRAYTETARLALNNAGIAEWRLRECAEIVCPYNQQGKIKLEILSAGGTIEDIAYGEAVKISAAFPEGSAEPVRMKLLDISAGTVIGQITGSKFAAEKGNKSL